MSPCIELEQRTVKDNFAKTRNGNWSWMLGGELVLVFYCSVANSHKISNLKQHTSIISWFTWVRSPGMAQLGHLLMVLLGVSQSFNLIWGLAYSSNPIGYWQNSVSWGPLPQSLCHLESACHSLSYYSPCTMAVCFFKVNRRVFTATSPVSEL